MGRSTDDEGTLEDLPTGSILSSHHSDLHIVLECDRPWAGSTRHCLDDVDEILFGRGPVRCFERRREAGLRVLAMQVPDSHMSSRHAKLRRIDGHWVLEDADSRNGSYVQGRRVARAPLVDGSVFELGHTHFLFRSSQIPSTLVAGPPDLTAPVARHAALATLSHEREALFGRLVEAARAGASVLLLGEAGSGKDTLARAIHAEAGGRGRFVAVRCMLLGRSGDSSPPSDVVEKLTHDFAQAAGGTLFLDEIDALSPVAQLGLMPLLRSARRAGIASIVSSVRSSDPRPAVPRIPADLLAELAAFPARLPPLRERREDIGTLVAQFLQRAAGAADETITRIEPSMGQALLLHDWPYNLSELDRCVRTALALSDEGRICWSPEALFGARTSTILEVTADPTPTPPAANGRVHTRPEPEPEFVQEVRRALKCNLSVAGLQKNGLLSSHMVLEATKGSSAVTAAVPALREIFLSAIESLRSSSPRGDKQGRVLHLTFIKPASTQQAAAEQLAMAYGTYRRYVTSALAELTSILWFNELSARRRQERDVATSGLHRAPDEPMG